ncbi:formylglycine-generating enzyme family protein, partial [Desulfococcaceae bacterium OttesenSCG-928-F15]|nr:formylglycine-generating enzyme family protein [Desulfococcaceae bacterium OttesenSCG-928-F15]
FLMGSPKDEEGRSSDERLHGVRLTRDFYLGKYLVTQAQWKAVIGNNIGRFKALFGGGENPSIFKGGNHPVERVSWKDTQEFIKKLNQKEGTDKYRLPTEAEWEYAARAGSSTAYSFGDDASQLGKYAWHWKNSGGTTHSVGEKLPNAWSLYDMHGNVWEWTQDWYGDYSSSSQTDSRGPNFGQYRVLRGGSWGYNAQYCRSASRSNNVPGCRSDNYGFRLAFFLGQ